MAGRGVNKVILVGNVGRDPEIRYTRNNQAVASFSLATTESVYDKESNSRNDRTEWHRLVCFGKLCEIIEKYVKKGQKLYVEGRLQTRKWEDERTNQMKYSTEVICSEVIMLNNPDSSGSYDRSNYDRQSYDRPSDDRQSYDQSNSGSSQGESGQTTSSDSSTGGGGSDIAQEDDFGDDLPW